MEEEEKSKRPCCLSHAFFTEALRNPSKIAVVHASGASRICKESRARIHDPNFDDAELFDRCRESSSPPVYSGDDCFTYADVLSAVDSLSSQIRHVLDGGDDPDVVRPKGYFHGELTANNQISESPTSVGLTGQLENGSQCTCPPSASVLFSCNEGTSTETHKQSAVAGTPQVVGILIVPSVEYIVAVLSVLRCGEAFLPLDPYWPKDRILSTVSSSKVSLLIKCTSSFGTSGSHLIESAEWLQDQSCSVLCMSIIGNCKEKFGRSNLPWPCENRNPRMFCYSMYTSGSTGKPKGVYGTEKGLLNRFLWMQALFPLHEGDILIFKTSVSFVDHLQEFLSAVLTCTPLIIPPFHVLKENPLYLVNFLKVYCVSRLTTVPSLMRVILPAMQGPHKMQIKESLRLLVLSGEVLPISLWEILHKLLPETSILNLYGSTEVSGDCMYFDCKNMPLILETEVLTSIPIGIPISNCDIVLVGETDEPDEGEIHVGGSCLCAGHTCYPVILSSNNVMSLQDDGPFYGIVRDNGSLLYFRTGDFARRLQSGNFVFLGRKDRIVKVNGQRVALEEIENILREHSNVVDAAVTFHKGREEHAYLEAYLVLKRKDKEYHLVNGKYVCEGLSFSMRRWLAERLPAVMIPNHYFCTDSFPLSASGKIDYGLLTGSTFARKRARNEIDDYHSASALFQAIKQAFCEALMIEGIADFDDFFVMGGNSIAAAHVAHKLGIDMRLLYIFSTPCQLLNALLDRKGSYENMFSFDPSREAFDKNMIDSDRMTNDIHSIKSHGSSVQMEFGEWAHNFTQKLDTGREGSLSTWDDDSPVSMKSLKTDASVCTTSSGTAWLSFFSLPAVSSFSRCNKVMYERELEVNNGHQECLSVEIPRNENKVMQEMWKVHLRSCVDASPLVVFKDGDVSLLIGSHSYLFLCINALSGLVRWEVKLEGRVECSAAITGDFSQVVVGCYKGKIYFLDFMSGSISWVFQTGGESGSIFWVFQTGGKVKSQPVVDKYRNVIWCGSHDHNLYALDYKHHCCVYTISCSGSIYGSPAIDLICSKLYVASTSGRVTAISIKAIPFNVAWLCELGAPIFGSLSISSLHGNVICCLVDGHVVALDSSGSIIWKAITGGPIFAGPCISSALPSQVLVCCRNGSIYSFELEGGDILWEYQIGDPITSAAYVDENILIFDDSCPSDRLACICSCSGSIYVLRISQKTVRERTQCLETPADRFVQKFASIDLPGDIFSSPVMIGGRIFVGCRDDNVHCIDVKFSSHL